MPTKCETKGCNKSPAPHFNRITKSLHCADCAEDVQGLENTMPRPIKIFQEFWEPGYCEEEVASEKR